MEQMWLKRVGDDYKGVSVTFYKGRCYQVVDEWEEDWVIVPDTDSTDNRHAVEKSNRYWQPVWLINGIELPVGGL